MFLIILLLLERMYVKVQNSPDPALISSDQPYVLLNADGDELLLYIGQKSYEPIQSNSTENTVLLYFSNEYDWPSSEIGNTIEVIPSDQWVKLAPRRSDLKDVKTIILKIQRHIATNDPKVYKYTLIYLLRKLKWIYLYKRLRIRPNGLISDKVIHLLEHMKLNHSKNRSVGYYAKAIKVSEHYLGELVRNEIGLSYREISNLLLTIRILDLFYVSEMNFSEISDHLSFADQAHFSNFFKRELQVTPSIFRKGVLI